MKWGGVIQRIQRLAGAAARRPRLLVAGFCLAMTLVSALRADLSVRDETRVAGIAQEMVLEGQLAWPRLNGQPFLEYPSLGYLPAVALLRLAGGASDALLLLSSVLAGLATLLLTFAMGRWIAGEAAGLCAALVLQTSAGFLSLNDRLLVDPWLLCWITLSLAGFVLQETSPQRRSAGLALFYLGMAAAFLTKGAIGIAIPAAVAGSYLLASGRGVRGLRSAFHPATLLLAVPILVWVLAAREVAGSGALAAVLYQSAERFLSSSADHAAPFYAYADRLVYLTAPACILLPGLAWQWLRPSRRRRALAEGCRVDLLPPVWFAVVFIGLSAASAKRNLYLAPLYPALALAVGVAFARARAGAGVPPPPPLAALLRLGERRTALLPILLLLVVGLRGLFHFAVTLPNARERSARPLFAAVRSWQQVHPDGQVALLTRSEGMQGAAVYYLGRVPGLAPAGMSTQPPGTTPTLLVGCGELPVGVGGGAPATHFWQIGGDRCWTRQVGAQRRGDSGLRPGRAEGAGLEVHPVAHSGDADLHQLARHDVPLHEGHPVDLRRLAG